VGKSISCCYTKTQSFATRSTPGWNASTRLTEETTQSTRNMPFTPDSPQSIPEAKIRQLDDTMVEVCVGTECGFVSSFHLIYPKEQQLRDAYRRNHTL
jgi:hypothetical protein